MDRKELTKKLVVFQDACRAAGYPLRDLCLEEAFPGVPATSFAVKVVAEWVEEVGSCSRALDILIDILWDTVDVSVRRYIFAIYIYNTQEQLPCAASEITSAAEKSVESLAG